ncbi:hypothetical protein HDU79_007803 [Rhizoclosmatium sp. JEL0117]|nr:hypothetical protein HDU79_007803 [Rhizoclosmatium sp. JEL0117]
MFGTLVARSIPRSKRAPSQWTFNTRFPSAGRGAPNAGGGTEGAWKAAKNRSNLKTKVASKLSGLALPASRRLARLGVGVVDSPSKQRLDRKNTNSSQTQTQTQTTKPVKPTRVASSLSSSIGRRSGMAMAAGAVAATAAAKAASKHRRQVEVEREAAQEKYDQKFSMAALPQTTPSLIKAIQAATFADMSLLPPLLNALHSVFGPDVRPTPVQALAIPASMSLTSSNTRALLVGAETGGGKTLAYLIPMIHRLKSQEIEHAKLALDNPEDVIDAVVSGSENSVTPQLISSSKLRRLRRPRAVVLVPSRDLVSQVTQVAKSLCTHHTDLRLTVLGIHARHAHADRLAAKLATVPIDILVTTPHELVKHLEKGTLALSKLTEVVVDESDTLFDESNLPDIEVIQKAVATHRPVEDATETSKDSSSASVTPLTTYISATFPVRMTTLIGLAHPPEQGGYTQIATPKLHRPSSGLKQLFLPVTSSTTKPNLLLDVLKRSAQSGEKRVIVFVNNRDTGTWVCDFLRGKKVVSDGGGGVFLASGQMDGRMRDVVLGLFKEGGGEGLSRTEEGLLDAAMVAGTANDGIVAGSGGKEGDKIPWKDRIAILVATDVASRGVDTTAADHVILYDFPRSSIEYLHRVGRTARNGGKGRATSLLTKRDRRVADEIEKSVRYKNVLG